MYHKFNEAGLQVSNPMFNGDEFFFDRTSNGKYSDMLYLPLLQKLGFGYLYDADDNHAYLEGDTLRTEYVNEYGKNRFEYMGELLDDVINGLTIYADMK